MVFTNCWFSPLLRDLDLVFQLAYHYLNFDNPEKAKNILIKLVELYPNNPQYLNILQSLN